MWRPTTATKRTAQCSALVLGWRGGGGGGGGIVILDQLRLRRSLAQLLRLFGRSGREQPHLALELDQLLIGVCPHFQALELLHERITREVLVHLGRGDQLALLVLDLLGHALERLEHALVADRGHGFLDALVRLGALLPRDQDVLLALRLLDPIVQLAERQLELLGFLAMLHPRLVQLHRALRVLVVTQQGLLREVVPPLLHRQHGDRKSTRLNSSHGYISYAVFCLKKKKNKEQRCHTERTS